MVLHKPALEGAEEQNADHVTYGVEQAQQIHEARVQDALQVQHPEYCVECDPDGCHQCNGAADVRLGVGAVGDHGHIVLFEHLLATHAFQLGGEEAGDDLRKAQCPDDHQKQAVRFMTEGGACCAIG